MIYGEPAIHIENDTTDRIGIRTLVLSQIWQPSHWPMSIIEFDAEKPDLPDVPGGVLFIGEQTRREAGVTRTSWTFEGINGDGKSVTFRDRTNSYDYSFDAGFSQVSITKHPAWAHLKSTYGGSYEDGQVLFPEVMPTSSGGGPVVDDGDSANATVNPMFGRDVFFQMEGTYNFRYASQSIGVAMKDIGWVAASLPGQPPPVSDGRNWLKAPSQWQRRGVVLDITEVYWLSGPGGWPDQIYGTEARKYALGPSGTALTNSQLGADTGTLSLADVSADATAIAASFFPTR